MPDNEPKRLEMFPATPRADASYSRRLGDIYSGARTAFGSLVQGVMKLSGIGPEKRESTPQGEKKEGATIDRTEAEAFLQQVERVKSQYANSQRDPQAALQELDALISDVKGKLETPDQLPAALALLYKQLKVAKDVARSAEEIKALTSVLQKAPTAVRTAVQESPTPRKAA